MSHTLTALELQFLQAMTLSDYADQGLEALMTGIWFWSIEPEMDNNQIPGVVSSLIQKGFAGTQDQNTTEHLFWITEEGAKAFQEADGTNFIFES